MCKVLLSCLSYSSMFLVWIGYTRHADRFCKTLKIKFQRGIYTIVYCSGETVIYLNLTSGSVSIWAEAISVKWAFKLIGKRY